MTNSLVTADESAVPQHFTISNLNNTSGTIFLGVRTLRFPIDLLEMTYTLEPELPPTATPADYSRIHFDPSAVPAKRIVGLLACQRELVIHRASNLTRRGSAAPFSHFARGTRAAGCCSPRRAEGAAEEEDALGVRVHVGCADTRRHAGSQWHVHADGAAVGGRARGYGCVP